MYPPTHTHTHRQSKEETLTLEKVPMRSKGDEVRRDKKKHQREG